jgi:hypothetical protein
MIHSNSTLWGNFFWMSPFYISVTETAMYHIRISGFGALSWKELSEKLAEKLAVA